MLTREIPCGEWATFLEGFSRQHEGWLSSLEVLGSGFGAQTEARDLELQGITVDLNSDTGNTIVIIFLGKDPKAHVTHTISDPTHVRLQETAAGAHEALQIEAKDGVSALLRFRTAALPELVDGVVAV